MEDLFKSLGSLILSLKDAPIAVIATAALFGFVVLMSAISKIIDGVAKIASLIADGWKGFKERREGGRQKKQWLLRKRQFLKVLAGDLANISKAENWNDQQFTDLEAEVTVEGSYYSSALNRIFKRNSRGLRRQRSLIKAVDGSSEKCLLLIGDPGAGKSVAMRHLALQMIERSVASSRENAVVPLYVNLREMPKDVPAEIGTEWVKAYVVDSVRRGDADTADYIKSNWEDFRQRGIWFFVFDSFDEIPEVMHAHNARDKIKKYGDAIRTFMDGIGACRSVLASREYKSPVLTWPRVRILALSEHLQEQLINRTFLEAAQKAVVLEHIAKSSSATYKNPLFLSLLCRFVRANGLPPKNEHSLLFDQVRALASRDTEYIKRSWDLDEADLLNGAAELAEIFATSQTLSLAPSVAEIEAITNMRRKDVPGYPTAALIEALTYVKICRTDVASPDSTSRRFTFSHRRYQECLFAHYLLNNPGFLSDEELIFDPRWREYLVALLLIGDEPNSRRVAESAGRLLLSEIDSIRPVRTKAIGFDLEYYRWNSARLMHVLGVFGEIRLYAPDGPWSSLIDPTEKLLTAAWGTKDFYDRLQVVRFCGLGDDTQLPSRLEYAIESGLPELQEAAIHACRFVRTPSDRLSSWVRQKVSERILSAPRKFEMLRWRALSSDLPDTFAILRSSRRAEFLNRLQLLSPARAVSLRIARVPKGAEKSMTLETTSSKYAIPLQALVAFYVFSLSFLGWLSLFRRPYALSNSVLMTALGLISAAALCIFAQITCLSSPHRLDPISVGRSWWSALSRNRTSLKFMTIGVAIVLAPGVAAYAICRSLGWFQSEGLGLIAVSSGIFYAVLALALIGYVEIDLRRDLRAATAILEKSSTYLQAILSAKNLSQVSSISLLFGFTKDQPIRSGIALFSAMVVAGRRRRQEFGGQVDWIKGGTKKGFLRQISALLERMRTQELVDSEKETEE